MMQWTLARRGGGASRGNVTCAIGKLSVADCRTRGSKKVVPEFHQSRHGRIEFANYTSKTYEITSRKLEQNSLC